MSNEQDALNAFNSARIAAQVQRRTAMAPSGWEPGVKYDPTSALPTEVTTGQVDQDVQGDPSEWDGLIAHLLPKIPDGFEPRLVEARYDPVAWTRDQPYTSVAGKASPTPATTRPAWRYRFAIVPVGDRALGAEDLATLVKLARQHSRKSVPKEPRARTRVVVLADAQIGKMDHRGGTEEFLNRVQLLLAALEKEIRAVPCEDAVILDPGDLCEGFENTEQQRFTNTLSLPQQLDVARAFLLEGTGRISRLHSKTLVATVPSNHTQWRRGKNLLGRPGDDFGLSVHRAVADAMALAGRDDVSFVIPDVWSESLALQVRGAVIGLVHGHQANSPDRFPDWWGKQVHGDGPLAAASIVVSGHFHHLRIQPTGRMNGRSKWWLQAPTLDNGSAWVANAMGSDSEAGLLTFTVNDDGSWDNLKLLSLPD